MLGSIVHRMIFFELLKIFLMSLVTLTGMFLLAGLVQEASQRGLSPTQIIFAIPLLIPSTLPYTIPATTLFATCVVYGRMANDNEILVLKSAGVNIVHLLKPAVLLGVMTSVATMSLYYDPIPRSQMLLRERLLDDAEGVLYGYLKRERCLRHPRLPYVMFVKEVQGKRLIDLVFKHRDKVNGTYMGYDIVARAREARLRVDLEKGQLILDMERCAVIDKNGVYANNSDQSFPMPLPEALFGTNHKNRPASLVWEALIERRREVVDEVALAWERADGVKAEIASLGDAPVPPLMQVHKANLENVAKDTERNLRLIDTELHQRPALAVGCLCFVLIGCPVGIWASRSDYLGTFVVCFLPTVFLYYPLILAGSNLAKDKKLPIAVGVWMADGLLALVALGLIYRLMRR